MKRIKYRYINYVFGRGLFPRYQKIHKKYIKLKQKIKL